MARALILLIVLMALRGAPVVALEVGQSTGPVQMNAGAIICDTAGDARGAVYFLDIRKGVYPASCGRLVVPMPAFLEVVDHVKTSKNTYAILRVIFFSLSALGVQYGWTLDDPQKGGDPI